MKRIINICFLTCAMIWLGACDSEFEEINTNPNKPETVTADLLLARVINVGANTIALEGFNEGNIVAQHTAKINFTDFDRYLWGSNSGLWNDFYSNLKDINNMLEIARESGNKSYEGIALIMKSWTFSVLTDNYGDIPYTEATRGKSDEILQPKYDAQEAIYDGLLADLEQANSLLAADGQAIAGDLLYGGDLLKWKKFANSLRIRLLMRISNKRDVSAQLQSIVSNQPIFESNADNARMEYLPTRPNTWPVHTWRVGGFDEHRMSLTMQGVLEDFEDPRQFIWFRATDASINTANPVYAGLSNGLSENNATNFNGGALNVSRLGTILYEEPNAVDAVVMQFAELQFMLAEAAQKDLISGSAEDLYNAGVQASFDHWNVAMPADYLSRTGVAYDGELETIITQKWISLFMNGWEAWYDYRRTGFPAVITPGPDNVNNDVVPVRYLYPDEQQTLNGTNYAAAVARQGADDINTKVWWEK
ncbi:SusD/RagB family nutrient-binding outer membrane lipoprotein [Fulvivirgaceae bacterium BMA10]|uniref:SusD/RagB family nutrient-binding outer membrane lipoprotein n=1 Tax=Splendidivirga corallicola TaxID=3051826 RepID=A0ABT8KXR9_9BACT|nr:SusD/RagB family nutrient-binding outer membrane lipoprotein [Fulvivirgaceae bacterium BMA10]